MSHTEAREQGRRQLEITRRRGDLDHLYAECESFSDLAAVDEMVISRFTPRHRIAEAGDPR